MINYNPKEWIGLIFRFHRSDTFSKLLTVIFAIIIFTTAVAYLQSAYTITNRSSIVLHSLLGFVISFLLVFRTNTAYDRWWEGRKLWGSLLNVSRNISFKINAILEGDESGKRIYWQNLISGYALAVKEHLRDSPNADILELLEDDLAQRLKHKNNIPNGIAVLMQQEIISMMHTGKINAQQLINLQNDLDLFTEILGCCERIKNTPIPFIYNLFIKKFIFVYTITMPFGFVKDFSYWSVPMVVFVFYTMASLEVIAEEIEEPFGVDANDLPLDSICQKIHLNTVETLLDVNIAELV